MDGKKTNNNFINNNIIQRLREFITEARFQRMIEVLSYRTRHTTVVVEDLFQMQNISAVLRTCECYGVQDVHVIEGENEFQIHQAVSMGADKWLTLHHYNNTTNNVQECMEWLKGRGYQIAAMLPGENSCFLEDLSVEVPTAFVFGTELRGLSEEAICLADVRVKIPMYGFTESFNISNSVAITLSNFVERLRKTSIGYTLSDLEQEKLLLEWLKKSIKSSDLIIDDFLRQK